MADSVTFTFVGGEQFLVDLRTWRDGLKDRAGALAAHNAQRIMTRAQNAYPMGKTGNLRKGVVVQIRHEGDTVQALARSGAPHSHLYEWGTKRRKTAKGWNRGAMPATEVFVPIAISERAAFNAALRAAVDAPWDPSAHPSVQVR
jgi:hypothetical protein